MYIGVGRFRILGGGGGGGGGGARFRILGGPGGPNSQQAHDVVMTSCAQKVFNKSVPNNCISHLKSFYKIPNLEE